MHSLSSLLWAATTAWCGLAVAEQVVLKTESLGSSRAEEIVHELAKAEIIPTVIDIGFVPSYDLSVRWSIKSSASLGNTLKPRRLKDAPTVSLTQLDADTRACHAGVPYVIIATDPDAPSRDNPEWSEFCHWIAQGVTSSSDSTCQTLMLSSLEDVISYKPPGPPAKTGKHRYVFVGLQPANGTTEKLKLTKPSSRKHWGTGKERHGFRDWALENGLQPIAANFIYAQNKKQ